MQQFHQFITWRL